MSKRFLIAALLMFCTVYSMAADKYAEQWKKGNAYYQEKQYDSAAYYYEQIAAQKPQNAVLYYNLGNTYYRLNKVSLAVLNYERALQIDPKNADARENLVITQNRISNHIQPASDIFFIAWWRAATASQNAGSWAVAALFAFLLMIAGVWFRRFAKNGDSLPVQAPGILGFLCICLLIPAFVAAGNSAKRTGAVVMENDAALMNEQQKGKPLALIPEGTTVKLLDEKGMWVEVTLPDGRSGWLLQSQLTRI